MLVYRISRFFLKLLGKVFPFPLVSAGVFVKEGDTVLLVRFNQGLNIPGGLVNRGERLEAAAIRECFEETGLKVKITSLFKVYDNPNRDPVGHGVLFLYKADIVSGKLRPSGEGVPEFVDISSLPSNNEVFRDLKEA